MKLCFYTARNQRCQMVSALKTYKFRSPIYCLILKLTLHNLCQFENEKLHELSISFFKANLDKKEINSHAEWCTESNLLLNINTTKELRVSHTLFYM